MTRGRRKKGREVNGILLLDKPTGLSSNAALQRVKRLFGAKKAGHTGSLDPLATGCLPLCFGEATKFSQYLLDSDKSYQVVIQLGVNTTTYDSEGDVVSEVPVGDLSEADINKALDVFRGNIDQVPPMYSALKRDGQPLYKLARQGVEVDRKPRAVTFYSIDLIDYSHGLLTLDVFCSKGTYIRSLAYDLGEKLQVGAHVVSLRRLRVGQFTGDQMVTVNTLMSKEGKLEELDELLLPVDRVIDQWPELDLPEEAAFYIKRGEAVSVTHAPSDGLVRLYSAATGFLGIGHILEDGRVAPRRLIKQA